MTKLDTTVITEDDVSPFTTLPPDQHPGGAVPDGVTYVTTGELKYLTELNYGPDAFRVGCVHCSDVLVFERHPADWPNHPGKPGEVRVKVECPTCGGTQFLDGATEQEFVAAQSRRLYADVMAEVSKRLQADNDGEPVTIEHVTAHDVGSSEELAPGQ